MRVGLILHLFRSAAKIQRKRMLLTVSAIAWGTIAIVLLLSFGEGLKTSFMKGQRGLGDGIAVSWGGQTQKPWLGFAPGRSIRLAPEDVGLLLANVPEVAAASGEMVRYGVQLSVGAKSVNKRVVGVEPVWGTLRSQIPEAGGRFLDVLDLRLKRRVIFLGNEVRDDLFGKGADPVGRTVLVNRAPFTVVGVLKKKLQMGAYGGPDGQACMIPLTTFEAVMGNRRLDNLVFRPHAADQMPVAKRRFYEVMAARYRFDPTDERALPIWDTAEGQATLGKIMIGIELFLGIIGALTLLIGGVGVANIMYAAVTARTREIGILMALGARRSYVTGPLVLESLALTFLGGVVGIGIGAGIVRLLAFVQSKAQNAAMEFLGEPQLSLPIAVVTVLLLGALGLLAGWFPSRRATSIHPAQVLRFE
jgi:putative ABC transport system permease protein